MKSGENHHHWLIMRFNLFQLFRQRSQLERELWEMRYWLGHGPHFSPNGHFYSPIPSIEEVKERKNEIFRVPDNIPGVRLNSDFQYKLLQDFSYFYNELPFEAEASENGRYFFENPAFSYSDGIILYSMMRKFKPKRIIEIGSGYSSLLMLNVNEIFFKEEIEFKFIEPYPELLLGLTQGKSIDLISQPAQKINLSVFDVLEDDDFLFVDSTHVSKVGSDVNRIFFDILPHIRDGVIIHFHDIFYPFEYPMEWIYQGRSWNENYILRAFLQYNERFEILFFNSYIAYKYGKYLKDNLPLCMRNTGGSIWLRKIHLAR